MTQTPGEQHLTVTVMKGLHHCEAGEVQGLREAGGLLGASQPAALLSPILALGFKKGSHRKPVTTPQPGPFALLVSASLAALDLHLLCSLTFGSPPALSSLLVPLCPDARKGASEQQ